jgi:serine/threonine protein kinase
MPLESGQRIGRYEIRSLLGSGGMGEVYLAYDSDLEREIAIKVLREDRSTGDRAKRFVQEARAASALHHPNVAHVYEIGSQDDMRFIAMEVVEGETLRERLSRGPLSLSETIDVATQIASALAAAHKSNVIHRDIKPENVIINADGHAKVLDFGLAKLRQARAEDASTELKTAPGAALGTLPYMAPEQIGGEEVTPAADIFSLGIVIYEMISGRRPFSGANSSEIVGAILAKDPPPLQGCPAPLESIVAKCLKKMPEQRYANAGELVADLRRVATPAPPPSRTSFLPAVAVVVALAIVAAGITMLHRRNQRQKAGTALATAEQLARTGKFAEAYAAIAPVTSLLPDNDRVRDLINRATERVTIDSDPPGASVYALRFKGPAERQQLGVTPLNISRMPRADYLLTLEKAGYATATTTLSLSPPS